jgi:uncharacterized OsmC-like protein
LSLNATPLNAITEATTDAVRADPANAAVVFRAGAKGTGAVASTIRAGRHTLTVDEPPALGGEDTAANPVEFALASLISCQVVTYRFWADRLGIRIDDIAIESEGDLDVRGFFGLDETTRPGFGDVRLTVTLTGPETPERYAELHEAVDAHCPVLDLFANATPVTTHLKVGALSG